MIRIALKSESRVDRQTDAGASFASENSSGIFRRDTRSSDTSRETRRGERGAGQDSVPLFTRAILRDSCRGPDCNEFYLSDSGERRAAKFHPRQVSPVCRESLRSRRIKMNVAVYCEMFPK